MVFLYYRSNTGPEPLYAVVKTDGSGYRELTLRNKGAKVQPTGAGCVSWSSDNRYLAMCRVRPDGISLTKVAVASGEILDLVGERVSVRPQFSPDGRFIAYTESGPQTGHVRLFVSYPRKAVNPRSSPNRQGLATGPGMDDTS